MAGTCVPHRGGPHGVRGFRQCQWLAMTGDFWAGRGRAVRKAGAWSPGRHPWCRGKSDTKPPLGRRCPRPRPPACWAWQRAETVCSAWATVTSPRWHRAGLPGEAAQAATGLRRGRPCTASGPAASTSQHVWVNASLADSTSVHFGGKGGTESEHPPALQGHLICHWLASPLGTDRALFPCV